MHYNNSKNNRNDGVVVYANSKLKHVVDIEIIGQANFLNVLVDYKNGIKFKIFNIKKLEYNETSIYRCFNHKKLIL